MHNTGLTLRARQYLLPAVLLMISPWFFLGGPDYSAAPLYRSAWDTGHLFFFGLMGVWFALWVPMQAVRPWLISSLCVMVLGGAIEVIQQYAGREFSWQDLLHDLVGFWLGLLAVQRSTPRIWLARFSALLLTLPLLWSLCLGAKLQWLAFRQFPVIADFESGVERLRMSGTVRLQQQHVSHGESALAIDLTTARYSGASIDRLLGNWHGYRTLAMDIYNPDVTELALTLRISDRLHNNQYADRYNKKLVIAPGWNHIALPLADIEKAPAGRRMDLAQLAEMTLFSVKTPEPRTFFWDYIRLE